MGAAPQHGIAPQPGAFRAVGLDVGGTAIKAGRLDGERGPEAGCERPLDPAGGLEGLLDRLAALVGELGSKDPVGLAVAGLLDASRGTVEVSPNIPFLDGSALAPALERRLGRPRGGVRLVNDANAAALGEAHLGAGRGRPDLLLVTLGTGVGGGLVLGGKLWEGSGLAGEIGHVKIATDGPPCGCGRRGCLETFASATAAARRALEAGLPPEEPGDLPRLAEAARRAPGPERELLEAVGRDLGLGLAAAVNLLDLRCFAIGGGFGRAFDQLASGIRRGLEAGSYGRRLDAIELLPAELDNDAGWIGAARLALDEADGERP